MNDRRKKRRDARQSGEASVHDRDYVRLLHGTIEVQHRKIETLRASLTEARKRIGGSNAIEIKALVPKEESRRAANEESGPAKPWWPAGVLPTRSIEPAPGFGTAGLAGKKLPCTAISVFGRGGENLEWIASLVANSQRERRDFVPVFLSNAVDNRVFHWHGFAFEYFSPNLFRGLEEALCSARYDLIARKWGFSSYLDLGEGAGDDTRESSGDEIEQSVMQPAASGALSRQGKVRDGGDGDEVKSAEVQLIRASGLFDEGWFRSQYSVARRPGIDPVAYYLDAAISQELNPNPLFHSLFYARQMAAARRTSGD